MLLKILKNVLFWVIIFSHSLFHTSISILENIVKCSYYIAFSEKNVSSLCNRYPVNAYLKTSCFFRAVFVSTDLSANRFINADLIGDRLIRVKPILCTSAMV